MNRILKYIPGISSVASIMLLAGCSDEAPFSTSDNESSIVKFSLSLNEKVTRAVSEDETASLLEGAVMQITDEKGMLFNWKGYSNIPSEGVALKFGDYLATAYAGDSVPASFDKRYFKGQAAFSVSQNQINTRVSVVCKIANVVVNVNADDIEKKYRDDLKVEFFTNDGTLNFTKDNLDDSGYFMRSFDKTDGKYDDVINYKVYGIDKDGVSFTKTGKITGVKAAHGYTLNLQSYEKDETNGGLTLRIQIEEYSLQSDTIELEGRPEFQWNSSAIIRNGQISGTDETFTDQTLVIAAYSELRSLVISSDNATLKESFNQNLPIDLTIAPYSVQQDLKECGIEYEKSYIGADAEKTYIKYSLTLKEKWFKSLPVSQEEYVLTLTAVDKRNYSNTSTIRIANSNSAIAPPFEILEEYWTKDYLAVRAKSADVKINMEDGSDEVANAQLQYRKVGEEEWQSVPLTDLSQGEKIVTIKNLETAVYPNPGVTYECRLVGGEIVDLDESGENRDYQIRTKDLKTFTTETIFEMPNAGMEDWILSNKVWEPGADSSHSFWDTGNHGSTTLGESYNLTTQSTELKHKGNSSACLESRYVVVKIGAGNLFTGNFAGTSGSGVIKMDGMIDLGKPYNNSHPTGLRVWVNYRPKTANNQGGKSGYIESGQLDQGQIYIALASDIHRADTNKESTLVRTDNLPTAFLAFNEHTFEGDYGEEGEMKEVVIPFKYLEKAHNIKANYLVIVCSASKYGDYYSGADGSTMWVDDFELIYDDIE